MKFMILFWIIFQSAFSASVDTTVGSVAVSQRRGRPTIRMQDRLTFGRSSNIVASPNTRSSSVPDVMLVDWDDTLWPSSALLASDTCDLSVEDSMRLATAMTDFLNGLERYGEIVLVTASCPSASWVNVCVEGVLPALAERIKRLRCEYCRLTGYTSKGPIFKSLFEEAIRNRRITSVQDAVTDTEQASAVHKERSFAVNPRPSSYRISPQLAALRARRLGVETFSRPVIASPRRAPAPIVERKLKLVSFSDSPADLSDFRTIASQHSLVVSRVVKFITYPSFSELIEQLRKTTDLLPRIFEEDKNQFASWIFERQSGETELELSETFFETVQIEPGLGRLAPCSPSPKHRESFGWSDYWEDHKRREHQTIVPQEKIVDDSAAESIRPLQESSATGTERGKSHTPRRFTLGGRAAGLPSLRTNVSTDRSSPPSHLRSFRTPVGGTPI